MKHIKQLFSVLFLLLLILSSCSLAKEDAVWPLTIDSPSTPVLHAGDELQLHATANPPLMDRDISWSSDSEKAIIHGSTLKILSNTDFSFTISAVAQKNPSLRAERQYKVERRIYPHPIATPAALTIDEHTTGMLQIKLSAVPPNPLSLQLVGTEHLTITPQTLLFDENNWDQGQRISITGDGNSSLGDLYELITVTGPESHLEIPITLGVDDEVLPMPLISPRKPQWQGKGEGLPFHPA